MSIIYEPKGRARENAGGRVVHIRKSDAWKLTPDELAGWEIVMDLDRRAGE